MIRTLDTFMCVSKGPTWARIALLDAVVDAQQKRNYFAAYRRISIVYECVICEGEDEGESED